MAIHLVDFCHLLLRLLEALIQLRRLNHRSSVRMSKGLLLLTRLRLQQAQWQPHNLPRAPANRRRSIEEIMHMLRQPVH